MGQASAHGRLQSICWGRSGRLGRRIETVTSKRQWNESERFQICLRRPHSTFQKCCCPKQRSRPGLSPPLAACSWLTARGGTVEGSVHCQTRWLIVSVDRRPATVRTGLPRSEQQLPACSRSLAEFSYRARLSQLYAVCSIRGCAGIRFGLSLQVEAARGR